jgi:hypothetical protein
VEARVHAWRNFANGRCPVHEPGSLAATFGGRFRRPGDAAATPHGTGRRGHDASGHCSAKRPPLAVSGNDVPETCNPCPQTGPLARRESTRRTLRVEPFGRGLKAKRELRPELLLRRGGQQALQAGVLRTLTERP